MICFELVLTDNNELDWSSLPVSLDVDNDTQPVIELEDPDLWKGQYTGEIIYNVTFPNTDKNRVILGGILSGSSYKLERKEFNVVAIYNGEIMNVDKMYAVKNGFDNDGRFEVQLYNSSNWVKQASEKKINTIKVLDSRFAHAPWQIDNVNSIGVKWEDEQIPIRFPFVLREVVPISKYPEEIRVQQGLSTPSQNPRLIHFVSSDFTPWISLLYLLRKGFLEIGWKFECPFLESDYGRRIYVDVLKDEYPVSQTSQRVPFVLKDGFAYYTSSGSASADRTVWRYSMFGNRKNFTIVNGEAVRTTGTHNRFEESITPVVDNKYYTENKFTEAIVADFNLTMTLKRISPTKRVFQGTVFIYIMIGGVQVNNFEYYLSGGEYEYVNIDLLELSVNERDYLSVDIGLWPDINNHGFIQVTDIRLEETKLHRRFLNTGDIYRVEDLFYEDSLLDVLKGAAHMIYGKIIVDSPNRKVRMLSPYETTVGSNTIEGYYRNQTVELENIQKVEIISDDTDRKRYLHLLFKDSDEKIVNDIYPDKEKQIAEYGLHGVFVDYGEKYKDKSPDAFQNPYFKPTFTPTNDSLTCSAIVGYETGKYSNKGRRIVFALGEIELKTRLYLFDPAERTLQFKFWSQSATKKNPFWVHQSINEVRFILPNDSDFMHLAFSTMKERPDWEDQYPNLYDLFVKKYMTQKITSVSGSVWKYMPSSEFYNISKRDQFYFSIKDKVIVCYLEKIEGYRPCDNVTVRLDFTIGDTFREAPITTSTPPTNDRPYDPETDVEIVVEKLDCTYFITLE